MKRAQFPQAGELSAEAPRRASDSPYLTVQEAVAYLRVPSRAALYHLIRNWRLPHGRRGGQYIFHKGKLDAWVDQYNQVPRVVGKRSA